MTKRLTGLQFPNFSEHGAPPCSKADPEMFFNQSYTSSRAGYKQLREIKAMCNSCPYRVKCLQWALEHQERGIWGGTTEAERKRIPRASRKIILGIK
jgi:WhiB family redox-sensing transcriptional regulator